MKRLLSGLLIFVFVSMAFSQIPEFISFQGYLYGYHDTTVPITFRLYDAETGGSLLWSEEHFDVYISNGIFSVMLGEMMPLSSLGFSSAYWLELEISAEILSPRYSLASSPYAFRAKFADSTTYAEFAGFASYADTAEYAYNADEANYALEADYASDADHAVSADTAYYALEAESSEYADYAEEAETAGAVQWDDILDMPSGFADGVDNVGSGGDTYTAGDGISITGTEISVANGGITNSMISDMSALPGQVLKYDPVLGWTPDDDATGSGSGGLTEVAVDPSFTGDGTSGSPLGISSGGIDLMHIDNSTATDGQIIKNIGGTLTWASDAGGEGSADDDWNIRSGNLEMIPDGSVMIGTSSTMNSKFVVRNTDEDYSIYAYNGLETAAPTGVLSNALSSSYDVTGIFAQAYYNGIGDNGAYAVRGDAHADSAGGLGEAFGGYFRSYGNITSYGVRGSAFGSSSESYGVYGYAEGDSLTYGVLGRAYGGVENWAGYFIGNTRVTGDLYVDGELIMSGGSSGDGWGDDYVHTDGTLIGEGTEASVLRIANWSITDEHLADSAVVSEVIADGAVDLWHINPAGASEGDVLKYTGGSLSWSTDIGGGAGADADWEIDGSDLIMTPSGNVSIGTEHPRAKLHIYQDGVARSMVHSDGRAYFYVNPGTGNEGGIIFQQTFDTLAALTYNPGFGGLCYFNGDEFMMPDFIIDTDGNIGLGTPSPEDKLHISHTGNSFNHGTITLNKTNADSNSTIYFTNDDAGVAFLELIGESYGGEFSIGTLDERDFSILTNGASAIRVTSEGDVGIGTTSPTELLEVDGNVHIGGNLTIDGTYPGGGGGIGGSGTDNYLARWDGSGSLEASSIEQNEDGSIELTTATTGGYVAKFVNTGTGIKSGIWGEGTGGIGVYGLTASDNIAYGALKGISTGEAPALHASAGTGRAGYFSGDVLINGKLSTEFHDGNACALAYGIINSDGTIETATSNVSACTWDDVLNRYLLTIAGEGYRFDEYVMIVQVYDGPGYTATTSSVGGDAVVKIYDLDSSTYVQSDFQFVIYKP